MNRPFLLLTVFLTGMAVMAVEMTGSRLLAPYFGTSFFVWTNLIGVVLLALSLGYFWGGLWADRISEDKLGKGLYRLILATGVLVTLIPLISGGVFKIAVRLLPEHAVSVFWVSLVSILLIFSLPLFLFGMVTPWATRLALSRLQGAGRVIGSIYALSTLGSLVGTFLPVLVTVPYLGSRWTFFALGGILILLGALGGTRPVLTLVAVFPPLALLALASGRGTVGGRVLFEGESVYQYLKVETGKIRMGNRWEQATLLKINEGLGAQSLFHPDQVLTGYYWDQAALLPLLHPEGRKMLIIGLAGGTSARVAKKFFPDLQVEGVEIDPLVGELARRYFGLAPEQVKVQIADGRVFLRRSSEKYDFILVDVFRDGAFVPVHLTTREFFAELRAHLNPGGIVWMNLFAPEGGSPFVTLMEQTLRSEFPAVRAFENTRNRSLQLWGFEQGPPTDASSPIGVSPELKALADTVFQGWREVMPKPGAPLSSDDNSLAEILSGKLVFSQKFILP